MANKKKIALTGGATGGHIFPLLSLYNYFKEDDIYDFIWVGEDDSLEDKVATKNEIPFFHIAAGKLRRYFDWRNFYEPLKNFTGIFQGIYYIYKYKIDIVFSKGGYVSLPLCIAAKIMRKPIYIHESDTVGGIANRLVSKLATKVFYTFPNKKINDKKHILSGQILGSELIEGIGNIHIQENNKLEVLVIAGSQGSTTIFENLIKILPDLSNINFSIILGEKNTHLKKDFSKFNNVTTYDFVTQSELGKIYKKTDIAVTRAGATTLSELYYFGIHAIIVPLKKSAGNHQQKNAEYFNVKYGSNILQENEQLSLEMFKLISKYSQLRKAGLNLDNFFKALKIIEKQIQHGRK